MRLGSIFLILCLLLSGFSWAETGHAILIVGTGKSNAEMVRKEKALVSHLSSKLPANLRANWKVWSYHFENQRERAYCEKKLNILAEDLLFVGIVQHENSVPKRVVYRVDRVVTPSRAARFVAEWIQEMHTASAPQPQPRTQPQPQSTPTTERTPSISPAPTTEMDPGWRIQLGSFSQLKYAEEQVSELEGIGYEASINRDNGGENPLFKVTVGPFKGQDEASKALDELKQKGFDKAFLVEVP